MKTANRDALPSQMVVPASECASHGAAPCFRRERLHDGTSNWIDFGHENPMRSPSISSNPRTPRLPNSRAAVSSFRRHCLGDGGYGSGNGNKISSSIGHHHVDTSVPRPCLQSIPIACNPMESFSYLPILSLSWLITYTP